MRQKQLFSGRLPGAVGNHGLQRVLRSGVMQPKLQVSQSYNPFEKEADRVAESVMRMPEPLVQRKGASNSSSTANHVPLTLGTGRIIDSGNRQFFENRFGTKFDHVRVHTNQNAFESAQAINAKAYTVGSNIVFGAHEYSPGTERGRKLLAHELTHVIQQGSTNSAVPRLQRKEADGRTYVVQSGDTIVSIAKRFGVSVDALTFANAAKIKTWKTPRGNVQGFDAGAELIIPGVAGGTGLGETLSSAAQAAAGYVGRGLKAAWDFVKTPFETTADAQEVIPPKFEDPTDVIELHNQLGTFGKGTVRVTSTTRNPQKQLDILRGYCKANKATLDSYSEATDWLKGELDWAGFETCGLADQEIWLPFFFALYYGGGGPGTNSESRTLPLVASPAQAKWKGRNANASPHLAGKAMDVADGDLKALAITIQTKIPEFDKKTGVFPVNSTQIEKVQGQKLVHINFVQPVFPIAGDKKAGDKGTL